MNERVSIARSGIASSTDGALTIKAVAVATAFRKYSRYVAATAYRMLRNREDVEDVVQDVFLDAVVGLDRLRDEAA
ncbi:MAG TPA: sigma factor, partial [Polyangiaceae bacterium]|nr:sigma factor [Polyangiaceae bacterium]